MGKYCKATEENFNRLNSEAIKYVSGEPFSEGSKKFGSSELYDNYFIINGDTFSYYGVLKGNTPLEEYGGNIEIYKEL